ncbi:MAG: hypothetical protein OHK0052_07230 [Anaerolineales bacterium]
MLTTLKAFLEEQPFGLLTFRDRKRLLAPAFIGSVTLQLLIIITLKQPPHGGHAQISLFLLSLLGLTFSTLLAYYLATMQTGETPTMWGLVLFLAVITPIGVGWATSVPALTVDILLSLLSIIQISLLLRRKHIYAYILANVLGRFFITEWLAPTPAAQLLNPFSMPLFALTLYETISRLAAIIRAQIRRLEALNRVAHQLSSSIHTQKVITLIGDGIREALQADTYYVGFVQGDKLRMELLYDEGKFFEPFEISFENSLAAWVVLNKKSLFLTNVPQQIESLGMKPQTIGEDKMSVSWMGTPIEVNGEVIGLVAVASYVPNQFTRADLELLESIAKQSAMALQNAYHYAEVKQQSQRDSLTKVYNHGYFLHLLEEQAAQARTTQNPLALIMLDIDLFKTYNDTYGHLMGDQVLISLTRIIQRHIKSTDLIGRWGGEEFAIALPNANGQQATQVANRIAEAMRKLTLTTRDNQTIPAPTVSQGIAILPYETEETYSLIDLADQRLYVAKGRGRNQIEPSARHWDYLLPPEA